MLLFLVAVIAVAVTGGFLPALAEAIIGSLLLNYYFTPPIHQFAISQGNNILALIVFVTRRPGGRAGSWTERPAGPAVRARNAESEPAGDGAGSILRGQGAVEAILERCGRRSG